MSDPMGIGVDGRTAALDGFLDRLGGFATPKVLELGTLRWEADRATHHAQWLPEAAAHVRSDIKAGIDVDVPADAHQLVDVFGRNRFHAAIAVSVWEHLERPWVAADELHRVMRPGGVAYVCTHHTFPVHGYPSDFTRWTDEGLRALFASAGFDVVAASYAYPCTIMPPSEVTVWNPDAPAFLNVDVCVVKP